MNLTNVLIMEAKHLILLIVLSLFFLLLIIIVFYFVSDKLSKKFFENKKSKKINLKEGVLINTKEEKVYFYDLKKLKHVQSIDLENYLNEFQNKDKFIQWFIKFLDEPIDEERPDEYDVFYAKKIIKKNNKEYYQTIIFEFNNVDKRKRTVFLNNYLLDFIPNDYIKDNINKKNKIIYDLKEIQEVYKDNLNEYGSFYLLEFSKKENSPANFNIELLKYLLINNFAKEGSKRKLYFYLTNETNELIILDNFISSYRKHEEGFLAKRIESLQEKIEKIFEIYGLIDCYEYYIYGTFTSEVNGYLFDTTYNLMKKLSNVDKNYKKKYTIYNKSLEQMINKDNHKEEVFKLIRNQAQSFDVKYRPIIHIANKRVVTLGYMSFIKPLNSGIFKDYKSFKKAAIKYKKDKDVFSLVNKKIISVFHEEKPNSQTKLLLDIGLELVSVANKNLNLSSLPNDLFILGFEVNDLIDNENNENIINNLKSLKEKGCELALFTSTGDYNLKDRTYRLFDYFFFNSAFENNIKINDPAFIKARMYLGKLSKYNKIIVSYEAPTLFIVEMLVKSGIEYFSCDAIEKKENIPKPIDKKIEKRLLRMYKGD